ncbi:NAD(P)/FAD-dependent oxidoreductase [Pseudofrankia sp. DC12]|uniref:flavin-containing monooxygenase n=1 Tax=Pseudofrankia sp. DC12 TaxID=683315 RepID=UPI0005F85F78|nr:NAD(P)/FAD-dependent oxidoreductase [Pseudofrankia sp. DC12]
MTTAASPAATGLRSIVAEADPALLLAAIVSVTGETSRIAEFAPHITNSVMNFRIVSQMPDNPRSALDDWAVRVISNLDSFRDRDPLELDDESFRELASRLVGIPVGPDSIAFLREQGGFRSLTSTVPRSRKAPEDFSVMIIGAGMAGVATSIAARQAGFRFTVLEKNDGIGGVWWQNCYPGVGVDTHSKYYSFSFAINPEWTNSYPEGDEFREYLARVAQEYGVIDHFTFGAEVTELVWDEASALWRIVYIKDGQRRETSANAVVTAAGYLSRPLLPQVPGVETFDGAWFHSAEWDSGYDFTDKRVAVVGTGCTSVQIVDRLAPRTRSLTLFQRQPHWVTPSAEGSETPESERWLLSNVPSYAQWARLHTFLVIGDVNYEMVRYDPAWAAGHDLSISAANDVGMQVALGHLESTFADRPDLIEKMKPNFAFMGKRPIRDPGAYYETLKKETSEVVASGLAEVTPRGPVDGDGNLHEVDVMVYATGFALDFLSHWTVIGRDGRKLSDVWHDRPLAYLGCQVAGFPNLFVTSGPNANPSHGGGHNFCVEAVVHYIIECLQTLVERDARTMEPTVEAQERWQKEMDEKLADSIWVRETRATTYYRNNAGDVVLANPLRMEDYWTRLRAPHLDDLELG